MRMSTSQAFYPNIVPQAVQLYQRCESCETLFIGTHTIYPLSIYPKEE